MTEELQYRLDGQSIKKCTVSIKTNTDWGLKATITGKQAEEVAMAIASIVEQNMKKSWGEEDGMTEEYTDEMKCIDNAIDRIDEISRLLEECRRDVGKTRCVFRLRTIRSFLESAWVDICAAYDLESNRGKKE